MDRREMLGVTFKTLTHVVPHVFGVSMGIRQLIKVTKPELPPVETTCFPEPGNKANNKGEV